MRGKIFDTNKLIKQWRQSRRVLPLADWTRDDAVSCARELIRIYQTDSIVTPVYLEFVGGVTNRHEMEMAKAFLGPFEIADEGRITPEDWVKARQLAERIPSDAKRRGAMDCLIKAIAIRLRRDLLTEDGGMPRE